MGSRTPKAFCLLFFLCLGLFSCKKDTSSPARTRDLELPTGSGAIIDASNRFAVQFFRTVLEQDAAQNNKLVSPLSVYTALSMLYNGAANATRDSIAKTLQLNGISIDDLNALDAALIKQLPVEDSKVTMDIANSIWYNQDRLQPLPSFLNTIRNDYEGVVQSLDFLNPNAGPTIDAWIAQKTNNKIKNVIGKVEPSDWMYLVNAIYFNGAWMNAFKSDLTHTAPFHLPGGGQTNTPFMSGEMTVRAKFDPAFTLLELPYGGGKSFDMYLLMPTDRSRSITEFATSFDAPELTSALSGLDSVGIQLNLPKWEYSYSVDQMKQDLAQMGMGIAFGDQADLSNMYDVVPGTLYVSRALHKTYIKVSEQGTEAAAVTVIGIAETVNLPPAIPVVTFDHPFFYVLREKQSGAILFMGLVTDPS
jgi:serpin B